MSRHVFKLPDLGEGTVQAEIVEWRVKPGDTVAEDDVIVEVLTDKAAVEVPSPVSGTVVSTTGRPGESVAVGAELIVFETQPKAASHAHGTPSVQTPSLQTPSVHTPSVQDKAAAQPDAEAGGKAQGHGRLAPSAAPVPPPTPPEAKSGNGAAPHGGRVVTSPAIRRRAHEAGIDLSQIRGSGPNGRIVREDLEAFAAGQAHAPQATGIQSSGKPHAPTPAPATPSSARSSASGATEEIKVIGIRRLIAQKMSDAKRNIPHFAYVEEIDVTELESLRRYLNGKPPAGAAALTYLPFLVTALVRVLEEFPQCNATYDSDRGVIVRHRAVHVGVATQTPDGLKVPVVHDAQRLSLWDLAAQMRRVAEGARSGSARRDELTGSTITVSSLGKLGGIASTPIINAPEVAIIGVNRAVERPVVIAGAIAIRRMMNLSSSFDHRFVDGFDAAAMIQALKERIEHPATLFIGG